VSSRWEGSSADGRQAVVRQPAALPERQRADEDGWGNKSGRVSGGRGGEFTA